ncbi:MAG: cytochrome c biogenesis protein ResB [Spirulina sp. SIO3F2]|nr:cytochrome c biogenesis protein ResB [Spirulina sp. SIO3F2]
MQHPLLRFLGSIRLAVPLMAAIVLILIGATFYESQVGSSTVQELIYKSPWFGGLMALLALNLGVSAASRYPWRGPRKVGFALTHLGLIVLIAGAAAVIHVGVEGMLLVRTDSGPNDQIRVEGEFVEVMQPDGQTQQAEVLITDGQIHPRQAAGLEILGYSDNTIKTVRFIDSGTVVNPAVHLELKSDRMGQTIDRWLGLAPLPYRTVALGPAELAIEQASDAQALDRLLKPSPETDTYPWGTLTLTTPQTQESFDLKAASEREKAIAFQNFKITVAQVFPDFQIKGNQPTSASEQFNNPAVQLLVESPTSRERWFVFAQGDFPPVRTVIEGEANPDLAIDYEFVAPTANDFFHVIVGPDQDLYYSAKSSKGFLSGPLAIGQSVTPGWADFQITLTESLAQAQLQRDIVSVEDGSLEGQPALQVRTAAGTEAWLPWGKPTVIDDPAGEILAAFSPKLLQLPFAVKLDDFIVDRNEGSESVAMWTSVIRIIDAAAESISDRKVWMNHPTWYHGWKLAQASWNPGDLSQSTLQVKREPAWVTALTWLGSALVIGGIAVMFYGPAVMKKLKQVSIPVGEEQEAESSPLPNTSASLLGSTE